MQAFQLNFNLARQLALITGLLLTPLTASAAETAHSGTGIDESIVDRSVQPCQDFYQFACGKWLADAKIPADLPMWDRSFMAIREKNRAILRDILENYAAGKLEKPKNPDARKLGDFYSACMDEKSIEKNSLAELGAELKKLDALGSKDSDEFRNQLTSLIAQFHVNGVPAFFDFGDQQDFKDATQVIGVVDQAGLGLPDRDYYLKDDAKTLEVRNLYVKHIQTVLALLGTSKAQAKTDADKILKIETFLAEHSQSRTDRRDPFKIYHRLERKGLKEITPILNWDQYFAESGVPDVTAINVTFPEFFSGLNQLISKTDLADLKIYLKWHFVKAMIPALPNSFVAEDFQFVSQALSGQKELETRWKRCTKTVDALMGFSLGRSFVEVSYGSEGKSVTQDMIQKVEKAFQDGLKDLAWMDSKTKEQALKKLHSIVNKVGYPEVWRNYDAFKVDRKSYLKTLVSGRAFNTHYHLDKIGKPVDRKDWGMSPPTVNAYYDPSMNEMVFPAGILQPPFFSRNATPEVNYGGIGMVMGHELTHGFDDEGRNYDASGNLTDWWSPEVSKAFKAKAECVVKEYDGFESLPGLHLNGKLTLGENIADHGGIRLAYQAWSHSAESTAASPKVASAFTADQRFFLSFAQSWCSKKQEQLMRMLVKTDPHSPPRFRINGTLSQFSKFAEVFQCKPGTPMAPVNRCEIW